MEIVEFAFGAGVVESESDVDGVVEGAHLFQELGFQIQKRPFIVLIPVRLSQNIILQFSVQFLKEN